MQCQDPAELVAEAFGSPGMRATFVVIQRLAAHARVVLIAGETGTGKELAARALHLESPRRDRPFVIINCSSIASASFERELVGQLDAADGGTLFLDEAADLPAQPQARLLSVLDACEAHRSGSTARAAVDMAVVAATSRDLHAEVGAGRFRTDLYYRLTAATLRLPPLRERREDIPHLAAGFIRECGIRIGRTFDGMTPEAERRLCDARWDGNVRELRLTIERACMLATGTVLTERDLARPLQTWTH